MAFKRDPTTQAKFVLLRPDSNTCQQTELFSCALSTSNSTSNDLSVPVTDSKDKMDIVLPHVKEYWHPRLEIEDYVFWIGLFVGLERYVVCYT